MKIKSFFQNIFLLAIAIAIALILLEITLRILPVKSDYVLEEQKAMRRENEFVFYEFDRTLGWKNKPLSEGPFTMPDSTTYVKINSKGLRDSEYDYEKPSGVKRILVLGDSFTWGYGVEKDEIFTERLEKMLGKGFEVINAGVSGYGTDQELLYLEKEGLKYNPDVILVAFASNDFTYDNRLNRLGYYPKPCFIVEDDSLVLTNVPLPELGKNSWEKLIKERDESLKKSVLKPGKGVEDFFENRTKAYPFLARLFKNTKYTLIKKLRENEKIRLRLDKARIALDTDETACEVTEKLFLRMKKTAESGGAKLVVFTIPYKVELEKLPSPYMEDFIVFFKRHGVPCVFPYREFLERFRKGDKLYLSHDDHWSAEGHDLAAKIIYRFLKKEKLFQ